MKARQHGIPDLHPKIRHMVNSAPARLPQKQMNQWRSILPTDSRRCSAATVVYCGHAMSIATQKPAPPNRRSLDRGLTMVEPVNRSAPVRLARV